MELHRCKKKYVNSTHRIRDPEETYDFVKDKMPRIGVTTVEDVTGLDRLGIPVFIAQRVDSEMGGTYIHNGKGFSPVESTVSAMMESIERYSSEYDQGLVKTSLISKLDSNYIDPNALILPNGMLFNELMPLGWCKGTDIATMADVYIAANAVFHPFPQGLGWLFRSNTNGLASGNCIEESILHALCEVIERDAWSLAEISKKVPNDLVIDTDDKHVNWLLDKFNDAGIDIYVKDITSDLGIPTFFAASDDVRDKDPTLLNMGVGTHMSPKVALLRALTEVAQSRLTQIYRNNRNPSGAIIKRKLGYEKVKGMNKKWYDPSKKVGFSEFEPLDTPYLLDDIERMIEALAHNGFENVCVVDLTKHDVDVPVVRVTVPGLEQCSVDMDRIGKRARMTT